MSESAEKLNFRLADHLEKMPAFAEDEWAEIEKEVPKIEDPFLQKYISGREALIAEEKKLPSGSPSPPS